MIHQVPKDQSFIFEDHQLSDVWESRYNYELYGVISHSGSMRGGHYVSYVSRCIKGKKQWYYISDGSVSEVNEERVL